jgi:hypothetical protein
MVGLLVGVSCVCGEVLRSVDGPVRNRSERGRVAAGVRGACWPSGYAYCWTCQTKNTSAAASTMQNGMIQAVSGFD